MTIQLNRKVAGLFPVLIIILSISLLLMAKPIVAPVTMPDNPSAAPQISVKIYNKTWYHPPSYSTNPYTGETTMIHGEFTTQEGTIVITIKNRSFTPYIDENGNYIHVYYTIIETADPSKTQQIGVIVPWYKCSPSFIMDQTLDSDSTVITITYGTAQLGHGSFLSRSSYAAGVTRIFHVQAVTGYYIHKYPTFVYEGVGSEWTEFTVVIPDSDTPETPPPLSTSPPSEDTPTTLEPDLSPTNPTPTDPPTTTTQTPWATYLLITLTTTCIILIPTTIIILYHNKHQQRKTPNYNTNKSKLNMIKNDNKANKL